MLLPSFRVFARIILRVFLLAPNFQCIAVGKDSFVSNVAKEAMHATAYFCRRID